jgi:hypothetical protein
MVPFRMSPFGGKGSYALNSSMSILNHVTDAPFDCLNKDPNDQAFIRANKMIGGHDTIEEFFACGIWPLRDGLHFGENVEPEVPLSKVKYYLPKFVV